MATGLRGDVTPLGVPPTLLRKSVDNIRALCHDMRQPLAVILLLAGTEGGDARAHLDGIVVQAQWLLDMVDGVIGDAADDLVGNVDVIDLAAHCVLRAQSTAACDISFIGLDRAVALAAPVALSRAIGCVLDNAVRAAGTGGHVTVEVNGTAEGITIRVADDGPGLGKVPANNSLGLTITRALVSACGGAFDIEPGAASGVVARILLPAVSRRASS